MHSPAIDQQTSIKTKVALTTLLTVSIVLICVSWSLFFYFHNLLRESIFKQQYVLVSEISEQLNGRIQLARHQLSLAATKINSQVLADPDKLQQVFTHVSPINMIFDAGFLVIGTDGRVIAEDMGLPALVGMDLRFSDYVKVPLQSGRPFISEPFRFSLPPHNPMIAMVAPVRDNDGRVICLLAGYHTLGGNQFLTSLSSKGLGSTGYLYLLHGRTILMHPDSKRILETIAEGKNRGIDQALKGIEGSLDNVNSRGLHMLSSFKMVGETGWILAANIPYDDAFGQLKKLAFNAVLIASAGIVFSLLVVWYITRRVTQPIQHLISHVDGVYKDGGEWKPLELKTGDELERLANAFNGMMEKMQQAEEELEQSRKELETNHVKLKDLFRQVEQGKREWEETLDHLRDFVILTDAEHNVRRYNRLLADITGRDITGLVGVKLRDILNEAGFSFENFTGKNGELKHERSGRIYDVSEYEIIHDNVLEGHVVSLNDTTELRATTQELEKAYAELKEAQLQIFQQEKMASVGQLAAGVAHEINNPMGFISSNLTTLNKYIARLAEFIGAGDQVLLACSCGAGADRLAEERKRLKIDHIIGDAHQLILESQDGAGRVRRIVQDLKNFSRVDQANQELVNLNEALETTINIAWNEIKYVADLKREFGDIPEILCFPQQLNQVFLNLLVNAGHAMEGTQGSITIRTWCAAEDVFVSIADTGCGIPFEIQQQIFEPFFTTKEVGKGTGLGLSISYDIIRKHGGEITMESEAGRVTTFTVRLPVAGTTGVLNG